VFAEGGAVGDDETCIYGKQLSRKRSGIGHVKCMKKNGCKTAALVGLKHCKALTYKTKP
jgi:hypothetical protein